MNTNLKIAATEKLIRDYRFQEKGPRLMQGVCPSCNQKQLWTWADNPWSVECNRANNCGFSSDIKTLYPELFENYSKRFKEELKTDPNAAARAYLIESRGFEIEKCGAFTQGTFALDNNTATATVKYQITPECTWERFIDDVERFGKRKAHFSSTYKGFAWLPPRFDAKKIEEVWVVEGIFDAIALSHAGITAISAMSTNNYPSESLAKILADNKDIKLVIALDCGKAGIDAIIKWYKLAKEQGFSEISAAQPSKFKNAKDDWNDLFLAKRLTEKDIRNYRFYGALLTAENRNKKAKIIWNHTGQNAFYFEFDFCTYWFEFKAEKFHDMCTKIEKEAQDDGIELSKEEIEAKAFERANTIVEIANCTVDILYSQKQKDNDDRLYYVHVQTKNKDKCDKSAFATKQLNAANEFKNKLMNVVSGASFSGKTYQLDEMYKDKAKDLKDIETIPYVGYCNDLQAYVFNKFAVKNGVVYSLNNEDYFNIGKDNIKTTFTIKNFVASQNYNENQSWFNNLYAAFGAKGVVALAFYVGTLFAEQIRGKYKTFPFLEVSGEAGSGKSTLIEFLWKAIGFENEEGFNPSNSTSAGFMRKLAQISNLPVVLMEGDIDSEKKGHFKTFNLEQIKSQYNGRSIRATGQKNTGNQTDEDPFKGSIIIAQNEKIQASEAIISRICHLNIDRSEHSAITKRASEFLENMAVEDVSGFLLYVLKREREILRTIDESFPTYDQFLNSNPEINMTRIAKNHAQMMSLVLALTELVPITETQLKQTQDFIVSMAIERQQYLSKDHPFIAEFWDVYEYLESIGQRVNHSKKDDNLIAINMEHFNNIAKVNFQKVEDPNTLKKYIKKSARNKFKENKPVSSSIYKDNKTVRCYVFSNSYNK